MKGMMKSIVVLVSICAVMSLLLGVVNHVTAPIIEQNNQAAANEALLVVMPEGKDFQTVDLSRYTLPATVVEAYSEANGGYVFRLVTTGYSSGMTIMCGIRADGTVSGAVCLSSSETLGHEKTYGENFTDKNADGVEAVDTISGATKTTAAYKNAMKDALNAAIILGGGEVDIRTEEEILNDNLSAALPAGEGKFSQLFITEVIRGIDTVYTADNGKGYVCVIGEQFVGVGENGKVVTDGVADAAAIEAQVAILKASTATEVDLTAYEGVHKHVASVSKTATGNYILKVKGAGYGILGDDTYHPISGEYIVVQVSMTAEGKIIDCLTVSQAETNGLGSACEEEWFYSQFDGKTEADYKDVDAISKATMTTDGYKAAIGRAFETVKLLEGGAANEA